MPTTTDLYEELGRRAGYDYARLRYIVRAGQRAGLLPTSGRGKAALEVSVDDVVQFILCLAAIELVGDSKAPELVREFAVIETSGDEGSTQTLAETLRHLLKEAPGPYSMIRSPVGGARYHMPTIRFSVADGPQAIMDFIPTDPDIRALEVRLRFGDGATGVVAPTYNERVVGSVMLFDLARLLQPAKVSA